MFIIRFHRKCFFYARSYIPAACTFLEHQLRILLLYVIASNMQKCQMSCYVTIHSLLYCRQHKMINYNGWLKRSPDLRHRKSILLAKISRRPQWCHYWFLALLSIFQTHRNEMKAWTRSPTRQFHPPLSLRSWCAQRNGKCLNSLGSPASQVCHGLALFRKVVIAEVVMDISQKRT